MRWAILVVLGGGCNAVFGLTETEPAPDPVVFDSDEDGSEDEIDNCPSIPNPDQRDFDSDTFGDLCDNCSLIANASQETLGDADAMGDVCDPHPITDGDCPILVETFADPSMFDAGWTTASWVGAQQPSPTARVEPAAGQVRLIAGQASSHLAILPRALGDTPLTRPFDVLVLADVEITAGSLSAYSNMSPRDDPFGLRCGIKVGFGGGRNYLIVETRATNSYTTNQAPLSSESLGSQALIKLSQPPDPADPVMGCRVDHGIAGQTGPLRVLITPTGGSPAVVAETDTATVFGVLISLFQPGVPCPAPIRR